MSALLTALALWLAIPVGGQSATGALSGTITDRGGAAMPGVAVTAQNTATGRVATVVSSGDGTFRFPSLEPGTYSVKAELQGFSVQQVDGVKVTLGQTFAVNIVFPVGESALGAISGVVKAAGKPLQGAKVEALRQGSSPQSATTDADGEYEIEGLTPGSYRLEVTAEGFETVRQTVKLKERQSLTRNVTLKRSKR